MALTAALVIPLVFGFFALAFNLGMLMDSRAELQNGSDATALAAAGSLNGLASGLTAARQSAYAFSRRHVAFDQPIVIDAFDSDVVFGRWHLTAADCTFGSGGDCFEPLAITDPRKITAVKVFNGRDGGSHNGPLTVLFGAFLGKRTATVRSAAVAVGGGSAAPACALPFSIAECQIVNNAGVMKCGPGAPQRLVFSNAPSDAIGFANLYYPTDSQAPSGNYVADAILNRACNPKDYRIGPAKLQNGDDFSKALDALRGVDNKGKVIGPCWIGVNVSFPVTDAGCPTNPIFQGVQEVVGFVRASIAAVTDNKGNALACPGVAPPAIGGSPKNAVIVDIPCEAPADPGEWGGGRAYNATGVRPRLVE